MSRVTNKDKIKQYFLECDPDCKMGTGMVAEAVGIKRNAASAILNELVREKFLTKKKTKPVIFALRGEEDTEEEPEEDVFKEMSELSYDMEQVLNKCKLSAAYPGRGLPIMLLGPSGVGKSMLAEKIYFYARQQKIIAENAPFAVLNCADYANNKELLSSVLFGYKKGAFTGANKDSAGLLEKADQGYLLLDEVHRLPPEGQEKLFRYIDTGRITPLGDGADEKEINVKLIFATTENIDNVLLETFIRRIPLTVTIPSYSERSSNERMKIIQNLFKQEAKTLNCNFKISSNVVNNLLTFKGKGNIGTLKNIIRISCVNAVNRQKKSQDCTEITMQDLNVQYSANSHLLKNASTSQWIFVDRDSEEFIMQSLDSIGEILQIDFMIQVVGKYIKDKITYSEFSQLNKKLMEDIMDSIIYNIESSSVEVVYKEYVENILKFMQNNYGLEYTGTSVIVLTKLLILLSRNSTFVTDDKKERLAERKSKLGKRLFRQSKMAELFYKMVNETMDYNANEELLKLILILFFHCQMNEEKYLYNAVIITHGYSTASSIASLVNQVYSSYIFDAFDMPYDTSKKQIVKRVRSYLKKADTASGVLILADMGSVLNITNDISDLVEGNLGIINNVTTQMALDIGNELLLKRDIEAILKTTVRYNSTTYNFIRKKEKANAVLVCCMKGLEVADKICELLKSCFDDNKILIVEYDYERLLKKGINDEVFDLYNVSLIISTNELEIEDTEILLLSELVDQKGYETLSHILKNIYSEKKINSIVENIIKSFSLRNIMSQLTILNPEIIIDDVGYVLHQMELELKLKFAPDLKQMLYMHIGIMVERLMQQQNKTPVNTFAGFADSHKNFCELLKKCLSSIEKRYHVSVNMREIRLIYNIMESKMKEFPL
ncbi:sigma 54-interacting transcriptional regulator [Anaerostipes sp.]|uniref:sigma 54-interacting transcriptional regulator n=1 Tax=Anaerostipes sp. TaxID=1872530 RepID=UPI0025BFBEFF|nr:sigma 54-interacting transcriptional regulator [Anaerostipes sp.]MBS7009122.1 sigma 54-interacting transcriptional regulator [Anaerostipes sp.]